MKPENEMKCIKKKDELKLQMKLIINLFIIILVSYNVTVVGGWDKD